MKIRTILQLLILLVSYPSFTKQIHIFGDSHASFCFSNERSLIPRNEKSLFMYKCDKDVVHPIPFNIHWFGSKTMFGVGRDGLQLSNFGVQKGDIVVFVLGEIDARCHIGKQRDIRNKALSEIIDSLVASFLVAIECNSELIGDQCVIVSVVPPTDTVYNEVYPRYKDLSDRINITRQLNNALRMQSCRYGYAFLDIYSLYATTDGALDTTKSDGVVHVSANSNDNIKCLLMRLLHDRYQLRFES